MVEEQGSIAVQPDGFHSLGAILTPESAFGESMPSWDQLVEPLRRGKVELGGVLFAASFYEERQRRRELQVGTQHAAIVATPVVPAEGVVHQVKIETPSLVGHPCTQHSKVHIGASLSLNEAGGP